MRGVSYDMPSSGIHGGPRPLGGFQSMMEPSSPPTAWQYHPIIPKQEPMDHDNRNDSGMASGGEFVSSSPGSDRSDHLNLSYSLPRTSQTVTSMPSSMYYSSPLPSQSGYPLQQNMSPHSIYTNENNPLTPPNSEPMTSPKIPFGGEKVDVPQHHNSLTPPMEENPAQPTEPRETDGHLRKLQMALEKNGFLPNVLSPKPSECSVEDDKSEKDSDEWDDQGLRVPKVNSHGKVKKFKCKQCDFFSITKLEYWEHSKTHIKAGKALACPKCPFVTEYKHHLEYHLRNHVGSKPFKCSKCAYSCVNQSMLNSHMKSHSNIYQYRCANCTYATKYCHSLKLHLRKYKHSPAMVLNPDGTPNPLPIIDVYGTRRGPKIKNPEQRPVEDTPPNPTPEPVTPFPLNQLLMNAANMPIPFPGFPFFSGIPSGISNPFLMEMDRLMRERQASPPAPTVLEESPSRLEESPSRSEGNESGVLDLSKPATPNSNRRKGSPSKLTPSRNYSFDEDEEEDDEDGHTTMFDNVEVVQGVQTEDNTETAQVANKPNKHHCSYCDITFGDPIMYTIHMGYHKYNHPYTCNLCGERCDNKISFFDHIARTSHL